MIESSVGGIDIRLSDMSLGAQLETILEERAPKVDLLFADTVGVACMATTGVVFIHCKLTGIMKVMVESHIRGVLVPRDLTESNLDALLSGSRVYSECRAADLSIDSTTFEFIRLLAYGHPHSEAADQVGYSARHMRRLTRELTRHAAVDRDYPWPVLATIIGR